MPQSKAQLVSPSIETLIYNPFHNWDLHLHSNTSKWNGKRHYQVNLINVHDTSDKKMIIYYAVYTDL